MVYSIQTLKITDKNYSFIDEKSQKGDEIKKLSKINIFVGENNSGKSRLIRNILSNELFFIPTTLSLDDWNLAIEKYHNESIAYFIKIDWSPPPDFIKQIEQLKNIRYLSKSGEYSKKYQDFQKYLSQFSNNTNTRTGNRGIPFSDIGNELAKNFQENTKKIGENFVKAIEDPNFKIVYIPILRGLLPLNNPTSNSFGREDIYKVRTLRDYFNNKEEGFEIFTGLETFKEIDELNSGLIAERELLKEYQTFLSKKFFDDKDVILIPHKKSQTLFIKIGDETEREIYNLGDGLQTIIILTLPLFVHKGKNLLLFIEEPEKLLHPGLQRKLIDTLLNQPGFEKFQYFVTTHSNHLLDVTLDFTQISTYSVRKDFENVSGSSKDPTFLIENLSNDDFRLLELIGVRNTSVFLSNCTIWVEGITDRKYFRKFLEMYQKKGDTEFPFKEDLHYSFVEYGGSNITHWSFLEKEKDPINVNRLCGKLFLIADNPGTSSEKKSRHEQLKAKLGESRFVELKGKEIENLLTPTILKKVLSEYGENVESLPNFTQKDYYQKPLGDFIEDLFSKTTKKRTGSYSDGKSISDKVKFCDRAVKNIETWDDLSKEVQEIVKKIALFVEENNKK